jgi:hypothetical protein
MVSHLKPRLPAVNGAFCCPALAFAGKLLFGRIVEIKTTIEQYLQNINYETAFDS